MKKRLTEAEFQSALQDLKVSPQTIEIARAVLVNGEPQSKFVEALNLTKGAISQAVSRVWVAHQEQAAIPTGFVRVTAILPEHQAFIVKKWSKAAKGVTQE
nr:transcriptional regulator [Escherichia coli]